jgi:hypothetical protein
MTVQGQPVYRVQDYIPLDIKPYYDQNRVIDNSPKADAVVDRYNIESRFQAFTEKIAENNPIPKENPYISKKEAYKRLNEAIAAFTENFPASLKAQSKISPEDVTKLFNIETTVDGKKVEDDKSSIMKTLNSVREKFQSLGFEKSGIHNLSKREVVNLFENKIPQLKNPFNTNTAFDMTTKITRTYGSFSEPNFVTSM